MSVPVAEMRHRLGVADTDTADDPVSRRAFMKLLGASLALAGVEGCTRVPASNIYPYVSQPELTPGLAQYYATSMVVDGYATGLLVESHEGRPTKIEGNPDHPASLGAAGAIEQASVLQLYDPDRAKHIRRDGQVSNWDALAAVLSPAALSRHLGSGGNGLFLLLPATSSPFEAALLDRVLDQFPSAHLHFYSPLESGSASFVPQHDIGGADVILAVDCDFLASGPFHLRHAREFARRRKPESAPSMNRLYVVESGVTPTGMSADHRFTVRPRDIVPVLQQLAVAVTNANDIPRAAPPWVAAVAADLRAHGGRSLVIADDAAPSAVGALARQMNQALGNIDRTVWYTRSALLHAGEPTHSLPALIEALRANEVDTLVCAAVNPVYSSAGAYELATLLKRVRESVYLGLYENETARVCHWMVPAAHYLETWSDARAYDGTVSIVQPLIEPIAGGRSTAELLSRLCDGEAARPYDALREFWRSHLLAARASFEDDWREVLRRGVMAGSAFPREAGFTAPAATTASVPNSEPFDLVFRRHPRVHDGSFANNGWLQELPDPVTTLTWANAAAVSSHTAQRLEVNNGDLIELTAAGRTVQLPALVVAGHADDTVTVTFGHGRDGAETNAKGLGVNVYPLWPGDVNVIGAHIARPTGGGSRELAITQPHHQFDAVEPLRLVDVAEASRRIASQSAALPMYQPSTSLPDNAAAPQWAMTIDLSACIGCGACTVACQAENNIPIVGRDQVLRGREMHWLRIDWYTVGTANDRAAPQPMLCQHCENAPCEYVCPVEATVHSSDGLNEMVYNRCVGTRFCSNNCPYKVRRFNWLDFNEGLSDTERLVKNPDVTVRERGVMEKCTFCVQRIREAQIAARTDGRAVRGSDVRTACQQACPTEAILFGTLGEHDSPMSRARSAPRAYSVLGQLGTEPRVRYLARVRNPNRELETGT